MRVWLGQDAQGHQAPLIRSSPAGMPVQAAPGHITPRSLVWSAWRENRHHAEANAPFLCPACWC